MFISVQFGYNQNKLFNINCQIAPLLDAINDGCYKEMGKFLKKREEFFNKEISSFKKKEQNLQKKLERLEPPKSLEAPKEEVKVKEKKDPKKAAKDKPKPGEKPAKKTKKQQQEEEEEKKRKEAEEQERLRKEEEEKKKKEEEEAARKAEEEKKNKAAKKPAAPGKGGKAEEEKKDEPVVETEEIRIAREKAETLAQIDELKKQIEVYSGKLSALTEAQAKLAEEEQKQKIVDLCEKTGERKHLRASGDQYAHTLLRERKAYVLVQIKKGANDEEVVENIVLDGGCIRTPEEDVEWEEEQRELEALQGKAGGKPPAKK
ncbi:UNKNOWN [Stylonychia lemnae]|uniref:Uncharacterized protein n=1 Tax=Stylonychia lemnae TaxID=5949 RepID=A0A078AKV5_STYLE|nr:UNKNOWN [Stylonychia lemnae]|eukprot:CDW81443.1 UNKNOWN [Stylonychia lemnae]